MRPPAEAKHPRAQVEKRRTGAERLQDVHIESGAAENLRENGGTEKEIAYLLSGRRVELNALASDQLVALIERKLQKHGIAKVITDAETLTTAYRRMRREAVVQEAIDKALAELGEEDENLPVPRNLKSAIAKQLKAERATTWDAALRKIAENDHERRP